MVDADPLASLQVLMVGMKPVEDGRKPKQSASKWEQLKDLKIHFLPHCKHNAPKLRRKLFYGKDNFFDKHRKYIYIYVYIYIYIYIGYICVCFLSLGKGGDTEY
jgi:hypothetical protein